MRLLSGNFLTAKYAKDAKLFKELLCDLRGSKSKLPGCIFSPKILCGERFVGAQKE
jgi:hypothetical protein